MFCRTILFSECWKPRPEGNIVSKSQESVESKDHYHHPLGKRPLNRIYHGPHGQHKSKQYREKVNKYHKYIFQLKTLI